MVLTGFQTLPLESTEIVKEFTIQLDREKKKEKEGDGKKTGACLAEKQEKDEIKCYLVSVDYELFYSILEV